MICRTIIKDITVTINTINSHLENYSKENNLIEHNTDIFAIAEKKLNSSFPDSYFLLGGIKKNLIDLTKQWKRGIIDHYPNSYEDFILIGDFNESKTSSALHSFLYE